MANDNMHSNIDDIISKKIDNIVNNNNIHHVGKITKINYFNLEAIGLDDAFYFEKVYVGSENNIGFVDNIEIDKVTISLIKTDGKINIGSEVMTTGEILETFYSPDSLGMIIDPFGYDRITGRKINNSISIPVETPKIDIMDRIAVDEPLETGIAAIDLMFPIGKGQRQLIIGDKKTGKTQILLDTIANQKGKDVICIYVAIGKTKKELKNIYAKLVQRNVQNYTLIISVFYDELPPLIKLTPYVALSIAELYMKNGKDVLVCIDDLKKHADACREIALLSEKNTGRDSYPADIFYMHSRLLEKGCHYKNGGSITILPIVETKGSDITDYISTNVISITDGQIVLSDKQFKRGQKPAINYGLSVSRLGSAVQDDSIKKLGARVRQELLSYLETADVYQLVNTESMTEELRNKLARGKKILDLLKQPIFTAISVPQIISKFEFLLDGAKPIVADNKKENKELVEDTKKEINVNEIKPIVPEKKTMPEDINQLDNTIRLVKKNDSKILTQQPMVQKEEEKIDVLDLNEEMNTQIISGLLKKKSNAKSVDSSNKNGA